MTGSRPPPSGRARLMLLGLLAAGAALAGCRRPPPVWSAFGGDPQQGKATVTRAGCGSCHVIPGVAAGFGLVGPPLTQFGQRTVIAGVLPNTPANLVRWLRDPQGVVPGNAMPQTGLSESEARDVAAYLYTLR